MTDPHFNKTREHLFHLREVVSEILAPPALVAVDRAIAIMLLCHLDQEARPDGAPYVEHPAEVALNVALWARPLDVDLLVVALLHDTIEDQLTQLCRVGGGLEASEEAANEVLTSMFGARVAELVSLLSNERVPDDQKNKAYFDHIQHLAEQHPDAFTVKLADFWTNALRLESIRDTQVRQKLEAKYRPVMEDVLCRLRTQPPARLAGIADALLVQLVSALDRISARTPGTG